MPTRVPGRTTDFSESATVVSAALLGTLAGILATLSSFWGPAAPLSVGSSGTGLAVLLVLLLLASILGSSMLVAGLHQRMWRHRMPLAVGAVLFCTHLTGVRVGPLSPFHFSLALLFGLWLLGYLVDPARSVRLSGFSLLVVLFAGSMLWSALGRSPGVLIGGLPSFDTVLFAFLLVDVLRDHDRVRSAGRVLIWTALVFSVVGILQAGLAYFFGVELTLASESMRYAYTPFGKLLRASAFKITPNALGGLAAPVSVLALAVAAQSRDRRQRRWLILSVLVMWAAVVLSFGRAAWISLAVGLFALPFVNRLGRRRFGILLLTLVLVVGVATASAPLLWRTALQFGGATSVEIRSTLLAAGLEAAVDHPWQGVGVDNFGDRYSPVQRWHVHNAAVQLASELGLPGLLIFVVVVVRTIVRLTFATRIGLTPRLRADSRCLLAGLVPMLVFIQAEGGGYSEFLWTYFALSEALTHVALPTPGAPSLATASLSS